MPHRNSQDQKGKDDSSVVADNFTSYYLQRATREFDEDLDRVRGADDFARGAADALLPVLVRSLQQGTSMFSPADQARVVAAAAGKSSDRGKTIVEGDSASGEKSE